jgi:hypothetical protein
MEEVAPPFGPSVSRGPRRTSIGAPKRVVLNKPSSSNCSGDNSCLSMPTKNEKSDPSSDDGNREDFNSKTIEAMEDDGSTTVQSTKERDMLAELAAFKQKRELAKKSGVISLPVKEIVAKPPPPQSSMTSTKSNHVSQARAAKEPPLSKSAKTVNRTTSSGGSVSGIGKSVIDATKVLKAQKVTAAVEQGEFDVWPFHMFQFHTL